ncbi:hypothetical protein [Klebsiella sp. 2019SCSN059]|uniref:hypothetical protein n=1 Tax=Klebsiella sp. 2019SCSN059 TaxID=2911173 RepID=UPI001F400023|nr:hypothetical protein [Klebsiella sp. 2019SCSN059]MCF8601477.1 hypothetical protein [Klebsiella sp. 2019SCSN059]HBY0419136.1 hypothetical protein [Klebsiella variicola]
MDKGIIKAAIAFFSSSVLVQGIGFLSQVFLMRELSVAQFGTYALVFEALAMCNMVVSGAFRNYYLREINKGNSSNILLPYQLLFGSFWCVFSTVSIGLVFNLDNMIILGMSLSMVLSSLIMPKWTECLALGKRKLIIMRDLTYACGTFLLILFYVFYLKKHINFLIISVFTLNIIVSLLFFMDFTELRKYFTFCNIKLLTTSIVPFFGIFIANTIYNKIGVTFINHMSSISNVALYLAMFKFITPLFFIQNALVSSILPKFNSERSLEFDKKIFLFFAVPGLIVTVVLPLVFPVVISVLGLYKYENITGLFYYGSPIIFISFIYGALSNYISVSGGQSLILKTNIYAIIFYILSLFVCEALGVKINIIILVLSLFVISESFICIVYYFDIKKNNKITGLFIWSPLLVITYEIFMVGKLL